MGSAASSIRYNSNWSNDQYGTISALSSTSRYGGIWLMAAAGKKTDQWNWNAGFNIAAPNAYWQTYAQPISSIYFREGTTNLYSVQNSALAPTITWPSLWMEAVQRAAMWPRINGNISNDAII